MEEAPLDKRLSVVDKVQSLALEFRSLSEPIDRVKRLLHYASILPPLSESAKVQENRVFGCTTQVWLDVRMDNRGSMRFRVDSDSEITKGFCSCLMWVLDGAEPDEILSVTAEDLADMNVGLPKKGRSRVNTWHNVLFMTMEVTWNLSLSAVLKSNDSQPSFVPCLDESAKVSTSYSFVVDYAPVASSFSFLTRAIHRPYN
ncbi:hypothetical protein K7X08_006310 [Anisodus acutangulus]|uniref:Fe-S metabolism associated domain-containing protein n=1 Tax=Anisodus acutangulus TaxID=402998 RepID=A0A9Q1MW89_9SOLA|nr:hypothetical protein K7X08_006310 [Anisodus acutangulus]